MMVSSNALWYLMRGSGLVSLVLLTAVLVLGIATFRRWRPAGTPRFVTAMLHRTVSLLAVVFLAVHVITAVLDPYAVIRVAAVVVPFVGAKSTFWLGLGALSLDLVVALIVSSLLRAHIGARSWRTLHWVAYGAWPLALAHSFGEGTDAGALWFDLAGAICVAAVAAAVLWRLVPARGPKHLDREAVTA